MKNRVFIAVNDGSCLSGMQCVFDRGGALGAEALEAVSTGCSVEARGRLVRSPSEGQDLELLGTGLRVLGVAPPEAYPLQKKAHSIAFLREIAHLRARTNTIGAAARVRSRLAFAAHAFFQERGFQYVSTPIITAGDAEGAGALFQVTTLEMEDLVRRGAAPDYRADFFGRKTYLTVSGQLEAETYASALTRVYTFGPAFRAEHSNTARHLAEFWMIEPEVAFADLEDLAGLAEAFLKALLKAALDDCAEDLAFFDRRVQNGLVKTLEEAAAAGFTRLSYTEAMAELERHAARHPDAFAFKPAWGCELQTEHERFLTETAAHGPVVVADYPKAIKAFYMRGNEDGETVRAMDVLVPRLGEIIGGSEREWDLGRLEERMRGLGMRLEEYRWYLDLRRFGTVPHAGFGMGFERLVQYVTGLANIRDVIPYPRAEGQAAF